MTTWSRERLADAGFAVAVLAMVYVRFQILRAGGAPPTIDAGDWLAHGDTIFGSNIRSNTIVYPPLVPFLTKVLVSGFGITHGISLLGAVAAAAPATGLYIALRMIGAGFPAVGPALLILGASSIGEATAWGGFPQLIGFGLAPVVLVQIDRVLHTWSPRDALIAGVVVGGLMATSHFITSAVAIGIIVLVLLRIAEREPPPTRRLLTCIGLVILPSLWLIPLYITLLGAFVGVSREFRFFNELTWPGLWDQIEFLYRDSPAVWRTLMFTAVVAPILFVRHRQTRLWRITTATLISILAILLVSKEQRFVYLLTPYVGLGLGLSLVHGPTHLSAVTRRWTTTGTRTVALGVLLLISLGQFNATTSFFRDQRGYYSVLTPDLVEGIAAVRAMTDPDAVLAVTSLNDAPFGRWVEALADRQTYYGAPLRWLLFDIDIEHSRFANDLFVPPFPDPERLDRAAEMGIDLLLIPTRWTFYNRQALEQYAERSQATVVAINEELVVIRISAP